MIDLNSQSGLAGRLNYFIDAHIAKGEAEAQRREYLGASVVGHECERAVQYHWLCAQGKEERKPVAPRVLRIFDRGNIYEDQARKWLKHSGFLFGWVAGTFPPNAFSDFDGRFRGHADGVVTGWRGKDACPIELPELWENKCLGSKGWKKLKNEKLKAYSSTYFSQIQIYMHYLDLPRCLFTAVNADTMEIYHELVGRDQTEAELCRSRVAAIFAATEAGEMVPRCTGDPSYYICKWCDFSARCWAND
ncbi:MAG: hypothetical protein RBS05_18800 [Zoogloea oleivorans]|jgi:hypothetical protein|uniref:hypothetical protein n=1 Tax=Zoogloea oleivorans TaxID=1552750 RepID=UPI002A35C5F4|nr:hypothetical protein [Zoogloea oleivorans]MDY0037965.1 hypothetical protein [Zoogloea oleivorans]